MDSVTWATIPKEILVIILKKFTTTKNFTQYLLVNRNWHLIGLDVFYTKIDLRQELDKLPNLTEKLESLCDSIKNPKYKAGQYTTEISFELTDKYAHIVEDLMENCPNVKDFHFQDQEGVPNHIISCQKRNVGRLWKNLQRIETYLWGGEYPQYLKCLLLFSHSLKYLRLTELSENEKLAPYLENFKNVENIHIEENKAIGSIFDTKEIFRACPNLSTLFFATENFGHKKFKPYSHSITQQDIDADDEVFPLLKDLTIGCYTPPNILLEFSYIKKKFPNLSRLEVSHQKNDNRKIWKQVSQSTLETIMEYLFSLKSFSFEPCYDIQLPLVKQYYDIYAQHAKSKSISIKFLQRSKGLRIEKYNKPNMELWFNQHEHFGEREQREFEEICNYLGSKIDTLDFTVDEYYCRSSEVRKMSPCAEGKFSDILHHFTSLKELSLKGIDPSLCGEFRAINTPYESLKKLRFDITSVGSKTFSNHLCIRLPNLSHLHLNMKRNEDIIRFEVIHMPTTDFEELSMKITQDDRPDWKAKGTVHFNSDVYNGPHVNECVNIAITDKNGFSDIFVFGVKLYQTNTFGGTGDGKRHYQLKEKLVYNIDEDMEGCDTFFNVHIICNSIKRFKIDTFYNSFSLNLEK